VIPNNHGPGWMVRHWNERVGRTVTISLTSDLVEEEVAELREACESGDRAKIAKEACDVVWTAIDVLDAHGIDFYSAFTALYRSNLTKIGPGGEVIRHESGKIAKGPHYQPPDMARLLERIAA
jgi:predicted HAD superfamily Cof-like phosphohydrolase